MQGRPKNTRGSVTRRTRVMPVVGVVTAPIWLCFAMCTSVDPRASPPDAGAPSPPPGCDPSTCTGDAAPPKVLQCTHDSDCAESEFCARGVCVKDACVPGESRCDPSGIAVILCASAGDREIRVLCNTGQGCSVDGGPARCTDWLCFPGEMRCSRDGTAVESCAMDGRSASTIANCAKKHQGCSAGACVDLTCTPSALLCDSSSVYQCAPDGMSRTLVKTCSAQEYCDAASPACQPRVCTPGAKDCQKGRPATCNADGSGWDPGDACSKDSVCQLGACKVLACKPGTKFCENNDPHLCSADGLSSTPTAYCLSTELCVESASGASCQTTMCTPSQPTCNGNLVTTCKADGSGPVSGGTDCGTDVCANGKCAPKVCTPKAVFCDTNGVMQCDDLGVSSTTLQYCYDGQYCDAKAQTCANDVCIPTTTGCSGESYGTCNTEGSGYTVSPVNCATSGKICSIQGCVVTAIDEVGESSPSGETRIAPVFYGDVISATASRTLTKIQMGLSHMLSAYKGLLTWAVFESVNGGAFNRIATDTAPYTQPFSSSNAISVSLVAGRTYAIGVFFDPAGADVYVAETYSGPEQVSFGTVLGNVAIETASLPTTFSSTQGVADLIDHMAFTTIAAK